MRRGRCWLDTVIVGLIRGYACGRGFQFLCPAHIVFGIEDFYKVIAKDRRGPGLAGRTKVMAFDIRGTLGKAAKGKRPLLSVPQISLPTRLIEIRIKPNSDTTIEMTFDRGWVIHMRLHNADSDVKTTGLKWDVTLSGMPNGLYEQEQPWLPRSDGDLICTYDFI